MQALAQALTRQHEKMLKSLDESLRPFARIRDKKAPAPSDAQAVAQPLLGWMQRVFLPHLVEEEDLFRPALQSSEEGGQVLADVVAQHDRLRKLVNQSREEIHLLLRQASIREAWWDTVDLCAVWAFRRAFSEHIEHERQEVLPKAIALQMRRQE
ncbi:MAG: hemerythrin domain-containing protein [Candidatus Sumerlaeota bacterium]|nr:hemerythrin domain-containing protein [Candidatus Sumerlaeota bacterium]